MATKKELTKETGDSGVYIFDGNIQSEEYNFDLMGRRGLEVYDKMRRSDATVKAALKAVKLPIKSAEFRVDAAPGDKDDKAAQDQNEAVRRLVHASLFEFIDWKKFVNEALTSLDFGFSIFEMVFEPRYIDGQLRVALVKLGFRKQLTVQKWETKERTPGITQILRAGESVSIPLEKLVHIAQEQEGDNYEGISVLRTAYKHWSMKDKLYRIDAVGAENQALGVAKITTPAKPDKKDVEAIKAWAKGRRANETAHIIVPEGWDVEMMNMQSGSLKDIKPSIDHHDNQIMKNVLAQFLELGGTGSGSGSRAVSEDHSKLFILGIKEVVDNLIFAVQRTAVKTLVDLNFTVDKYPTLTVGNISDENIPVVSAAIKVAVDAGILHPNAADENVVRKMLSLPQVAIKELETLFEQDKTKEATKPSGQQASVTELRALRASIDEALFDESSRAA